MRLVVTGPRSVGKTTVSRLLAEDRGLEYLSSDVLLDQRLLPWGGLVHAMAHGPEAEIITQGIAVVESAVRRRDFVFDLAGGAIGDPRTRAPVLAALTTCTVIGLLPSRDMATAIATLLERERGRPHFATTSLSTLRRKVTVDYGRLLPVLGGVATHLIYVDERPPAAVVNEIASLLRCGDPVDL